MEHSENTQPAQDIHGSNGADSMASQAQEKVRGLRDTARTEAEHRVHELSEKAQERIDAQRDRVASRIEEAASRVRQRGDAAGTVGHMAGEQMATRMEAAAVYLHQHHSDEIASDFATYVKQHPIQSVIAAAFIGYVFGKLTG